MAERIPVLFAYGHPLGFHFVVDHEPGSHQPLADVMSANGLEPHFFAPDWDNSATGFDVWAAQMFETGKEVAGGRGIIYAGFSLGTMIAVLAAERAKRCGQPCGLAVMSPSPYWGEARARDAFNHPESGGRKVPTWLQASFARLAFFGTQAPFQVYVGQYEISTVRQTAAHMVDCWPNDLNISGVRGIIQPPCGHRLHHEPYLKSMENLAQLAQRLSTDCAKLTICSS